MYPHTQQSTPKLFITFFRKQQKNKDYRNISFLRVYVYLIKSGIIVLCYIVVKEIFEKLYYVYIFQSILCTICFVPKNEKIKGVGVVLFPTSTILIKVIAIKFCKFFI